MAPPLSPPGKLSMRAWTPEFLIAEGGGFGGSGGKGGGNAAQAWKVAAVFFGLAFAGQVGRGRLSSPAERSRVGVNWRSLLDVRGGFLCLRGWLPVLAGRASRVHLEKSVNPRGCGVSARIPPGVDFAARLPDHGRQLWSVQLSPGLFNLTLPLYRVKRTLYEW